MADSSGNGDSGCFHNMFRRISCFRSLPTHPADHIVESKTDKSEEQKEKPKAAANPGIVARLMGLESLPENNWVSRKGIPDSVVRSRSVNFADYLLEFDLTQAQQHRRVRTSVSFREVPTLSHQQNRDFLVVCLNDGDESTKGMRSKVRKSEVGFGEMKQRKEQRSKNKESRRDKEVVKKKENRGNNKISKLRDEPRRIPTNLSSKVGNGKTKSALKPKNQKKLFVEHKFTRKRKVQPLAVKAEPECDSQNASPVSVLDVNDCPMQQETNISEPSRAMKLNLSRKFSGRVSYTDDLREGAIKKKDCDFMDISGNRYYKEVVGNLYRLTENDIKKSNWIAKNFLEFEGFEEVCMEFEQQVLDVLLNQVVDEFVEIPEKSQ